MKRESTRRNYYDPVIIGLRQEKVTRVCSTLHYPLSGGEYTEQMCNQKTKELEKYRPTDRQFIG